MRTYVLLDNKGNIIGQIEADSLNNAYLRGLDQDTRTYSVRHLLEGEVLDIKPADWIPEDEFQANVNILNEFLRERKRQHAKWGQRDLEPHLYATIFNEEVGEVNMEVCEYTFADPQAQPAIVGRMRKELVQVGAVVVAMIACIDRNESPSPHQPNA